MMLNRQRLTLAGLRTVAVFEAVKGLLVIVVGCGLLTLLHRDVQHAAEVLVRNFHLDPARHIPRIFIKAAGRMTDTRLVLLAAGAFAYATLRFVEAYGLWCARPWAEWLAIVSVGLYLPVEVFHVMRHGTVAGVVLLVGNAAIVLGLLYVRLAPNGDPPVRAEAPHTD